MRMSSCAAAGRTRAMRRFEVAERRARLVRRHRLSPAIRAHDVLDAVRSVVALHSTDPVTVFLSAWARTSGFRPVDLERALYDERTLVRMLGMRRTLFVVPRELVGVVDAACARAVAAQERRKLERFVAETAWVVGTPWQGRGIATEAARGMVGWLRRQPVLAVIAHIHPDHQASAAVAAAVGLSPTDEWHEGEIRWYRSTRQ